MFMATGGCRIMNNCSTHNLHIHSKPQLVTSTAQNIDNTINVRLFFAQEEGN